MDDRTKIQNEIQELIDYMKKSITNYVLDKEKNQFFLDNFHQIFVAYTEISLESMKDNPRFKQYFVFNK